MLIFFVIFLSNNQPTHNWEYRFLSRNNLALLIMEKFSKQLLIELKLV